MAVLCYIWLIFLLIFVNFSFENNALVSARNFNTSNPNVNNINKPNPNSATFTSNRVSNPSANTIFTTTNLAIKPSPTSTFTTNRDIFFDRMRKDRDNNLFCDFAFVVQNNSYCAHKLVLSASSEFFIALFSANSEGKDIELLELPNDVKQTDFELIWDFMYGKRFDFESCLLEDILSVYKLAGRWFMQSFKDECHEFISKWNSNGQAEKSYALAQNLRLEDEMQIMIASVSKFVFDYQIETKENINLLEIDLENVPFDLLLKAVDLVPVNLPFFHKICNWMLYQEPSKFFRYLQSSMFRNINLQQLKSYEMNNFFLETFKSKKFDSDIVLQLQLTIKSWLGKNRENVFSRRGIRLVATATKKNVLKVNDYFSSENTWREITYQSLFDIGETFYDQKQKRLFLFDDTFYFYKTMEKPMQYAIYDLNVNKVVETYSTFPGSIAHQFHSVYVNQTKIYLIGLSYSLTLQLVIYDLESKENTVHMLSPRQAIYGTLTVYQDIVYYSNGKQIFKFDPKIGINSHQLYHTLPRFANKQVPKIFISRNFEYNTIGLFADGSGLYYWDSNKNVAVNMPGGKDNIWKNPNWIQFTHQGGLFLMSSGGENEMEFSFYEYDDWINKMENGSVISYVTKPPLALGNSSMVKYFVMDMRN